MNWYTVILLAPDYADAQYGEGVTIHKVVASNPRLAEARAQRDEASAYFEDGEDIEAGYYDWKPIAVFLGHHINLEGQS